MTLALIIQVAIVTGAALAAGWLLRRRSAALQHAIYVTALGAALVLPAVRWLPLPETPVLSALELPATIAETTIVVRPETIDWNLWLNRLWLAGIAVLMLRYVAGTLRAVWLRRSGRLLSAGVVEHPGISSPMVFGWVRPVILLPESAARWPREQQETVLTHERAHIARGDCWWTLITEAARAVYWFLPSAWLTAKKARQAAERAADDAVLRAGNDPSLYAGHLVQIAREASTRWEAAASVAMAEPSHLERRVTSILNSETPRSGLRRASIAVIVSAASCLILLITGAVTTQAQAPAVGTIEVSVVDPSGGRVPGYFASVEDHKGRIQQTVTADQSGTARFVSLPTGDYLLEIRAPGFAAFHKGVRLDDRAGAKVEVGLQPGMIFESLKVKAGAGTANAAQPPAQAIRVGGNIQAAKLISQSRPAYPQAAKDARIQGTVFLQALILANGTMGEVEVLSAPDPSLAEAAVAAVRQWIYQPTLLNGNPVDVITKITVNFTLSE